MRVEIINWGLGGAYVSHCCSGQFTKRLLGCVRWKMQILMLPLRSYISLYLTLIWLYSSNDKWWLEREATVRGRDPQIYPCNDSRSVKHSCNLVTVAKLDLTGYCKKIHTQSVRALLVQASFHTSYTRERCHISNLWSFTGVEWITKKQ